VQQTCNSGEAQDALEWAYRCASKAQDSLLRGRELLEARPWWDVWRAFGGHFDLPRCAATGARPLAEIMSRIVVAF
jgi:hypothetical protein